MEREYEIVTETKPIKIMCVTSMLLLYLHDLYLY